jgi:hypothetical protein
MFRCSAVLLFALASAVPSAAAQTWVEVNGGSWHLDSALLGQIEGKLEATVASSAKTQRQTLSAWPNYSIQYQGKLVDGHRVVEIRGACHVSPGRDLRSEFLDVVDGGPCYFALLYRIDSKRFSNVIFNGYA